MQGDVTASISNRMIRAARLESGLYEEVERDVSATTQALTVVIIVALASGIGSALGLILRGNMGFGAVIVAFVFGIIWAVIFWAIWSFITYWLGTNLFGGTATYGELLRTIGFAQSPSVLAIFTFIPAVGPLIAFIAGIWSLIAGIIAVRQALDFSTGKAIITAIIGWIILMVIFAILGGLGIAGVTMMGR